MSKPVLQTERLKLRELTPADGDFYLAMLTDPDFKVHIADRGVRSVQQAVEHLRERVLASYLAHGFGMWLVSRRDDGSAVGMAGLVKRDFLENVDLGYAFLPSGRGLGFATEACRGVMDHARRQFGIDRLAAIVSPRNAASIRVLTRLGFRHSGPLRFPDDGDICEHYLCDLQ